MRVSAASALLSFAALASAWHPADGPDDGHVTITVATGSTYAGYEFVANLNGATPFPELVPAAKASTAAASVWRLFYENSVHFGWYSITTNITTSTYAFDVDAPDGIYVGLAKLIVSTPLDGTNIWTATTADSKLTWNGNPSDFTYACTNTDGHIHLGIYTPGKQPKTCTQVQLLFHTVA
ncbi:hypothetical protein F4859DRAFT_231012 [Xylaria cf. heliscus]|nr:hypothetical protein F4859DRAFT_231012 [Xylaria cf. heliscus]